MIGAALEQLGTHGITVLAAGEIVTSRPLGPSLRSYANSAALVASDLAPRKLLGRLKQVERRFGRRARGQRWSARVLDLDIVLWSGGCWSDRHLTIPHRLFRQRDFVLIPAQKLAAGWRDPLTGLTLRQLHHRLTRRRPAPR